jgi:hypothetical protein
MRAGDERSPSAQEDRFPGEGELASMLDLLPLASLVLAADASVAAVNQEWALLSAVPGEAAQGDGWLGAVESRDREPLRRLLAGAVAAGEPGSGEFRLTGSGGGRRSLWWWRPGPSGQLLVCVADLDQHVSGDEGPWPRALTGPPIARARRPAQAVSSLAASDSAAAGRGDLMDVVTLVVHRLFGIGLVLESASGLADGPAAARLQHAVDELDAVIRDVRTAAFGSGPPGCRPR